jgi:shikimate dehydrogenase
VVWALVGAGANVWLWNRSPARAEALAAALGATALADQHLATAVQHCQLLVNTTSVGLNDPHSSPLPAEILPQQGWVNDIVYKPLQTKLLRQAKAKGLATIDGLGMLVHQGALALSAWTGQSAPVEVMRQALEQQLV